MAYRFIQVLFLLLFTSTVDGFNLDSLLIKSVGGYDALRALERLNSYQLSGTAMLNDKKGKFVQYFMKPNHYYLKVEFPKFSLVQAYDGKTAWQKDLNGQFSEVKGIEKENLLTDIYFESYAYLFPERIQGGMTYLGEKEIDSQFYHEVAFFPYEVDTIYSYFDIESGLQRIKINQLDQMKAITYKDDYRDVSNILMPYYTKTDVKEASFITSTEVEKFEVNPYFDTSIFIMPLTSRIDYHFPDNVREIQLPFEYRFGHIKLPVVINGTVKVWVILDSGASSNIFHKPALDSLKLTVAGTVPAMGLSGYASAELVQIDSIQIGDLTLYNQVAGSMYLDNVSRQIGDEKEFGGLLGYDFLSRFPILIDYRKSTLTIFNPKLFEPPEGGKEIDFHLTMQIPTINCEINGIRGDFLVDLGNAVALIVHRKFAKQNKLEANLSDIKENSRLAGGIGGPVSGKKAQAAMFKIGDMTLESIEVLLPESSYGIAGSYKLAGNIGNRVLEKLKVLFDYQNSRLIFYNLDKKKNK